ncbi:MAG: GntR family transcriptional regulator, partial [Bradyrhizobium sp.]
MEAEFSKVDIAHAKIKHLVTLYDFVADRRLQVLPGQHLHINELSDRVRVSATPVRQALERLHGEGLIDCIPGRGFFSKVPDATELQELYEFALLVLDRSLLAGQDVIEAGALKAGIGAGMPPVRAPSAEEDHPRNALFIEAVSEWITGLSKNRQMLRMMKNFHDRSRYVRCLTLANCPNTSIHFTEIMTLIDLVRTGQT